MRAVNAATTVGKSSRGYHARKKINISKWRSAVDTLSLLLCLVVTTASAQDPPRRPGLLQRLTTWFRRIPVVWADRGYAGKLISWTAAHVRLRL